jgi:diguanylate cyclase (GGDEF)-like protein/PAS domain S-box-containing protein
MTHSVESRFLAILSGALLIFVAPLFILFLFLSSSRARTDIITHATIVSTSNAKALSQPLWDFDSESVGDIADTIAGDPAVAKVVVRDTANQFHLTRMSPSFKPEVTLDSVTEAIVHDTTKGRQTIGQLTVYYPEVGLFSSLKPIELGFISIFAFAIMAVSAAAIIGNRIMIITPLLRLTAAVDATRKFGSRQRVDWDSRDEMGDLAARFNEMQSKLEREEKELRLAHRRATDIYNRTPAMLYSVDAEDRITAVSDYWLVATGYSRGEVIGRFFSSMVDPADFQRYRQRGESAGEPRATREVTVRFLKADGSRMDVLIVETPPGAGDLRSSFSLSVMTDVTALKESEARIRLQAITDHLTGLMNRKGFEAALEERIRAADATGQQVACLFIDLDRFKWINDNLGHAAGDAVLCDVVRKLTPLLRPDDCISRLGGDEFAILRMAADVQQPALDLAKDLIGLFEHPFDAGVMEARLSASIGIAYYPLHASSGAELLQMSDMAMYSRKRDGRNGAIVYDPSMTDKTRRRAEIEEFIETGLAQDWLDAYFQPLINLTTGEIVGFEALMRLIHPVKGVLPPAEIISVAEEVGSIIPIGNRMLEKSLEHFARLVEAQDLPDAYVAINFSSLQIEPGLPARLASLLERHGIEPRALVVEITEAVLMQDNPEVSQILEQVRRYGCRIALDDFGTGYSSLSYLNRFPVDIVKVDQSFVRALTESKGDVYDKSRMLVEGITAISHKMACTVIAEGIETREQWRILLEMGVDCGQGYLFSRPLPVPELEDFMQIDLTQNRTTGMI